MGRQPNTLLDLETIKKYDKKGMFQVYDQWPEIALSSFENDLEGISHDGIDHLVFAGMGGSGAIGSILSSILSKTNLHVTVVKGYLLPRTVDENTLVVNTSISGNTVETLTALDSTKKLKCKTIAFSSGGKIEKYCKDNNIEYRKIPQIHSPRASFTGFLYSMLKVLSSIVPVDKKDVLESISILEKCKKEISSENLTDNNPALNLAEWITGIPIIYYPWGLNAAAIRFKNSLQENSKMHAMTEDVIEACHNGIVSWDQSSNVQPILIQGIDDYTKTKERWMILKEFFDTKKINYREIFSESGNILSKLMGLVYFLDYSTIYRAVLSSIDPTPIEPIDFVKRRL